MSNISVEFEKLKAKLGKYKSVDVADLCEATHFTTIAGIKSGKRKNITTDTFADIERALERLDEKSRKTAHE